MTLGDYASVGIENIIYIYAWDILDVGVYLEIVGRCVGMFVEIR